MSNKNMNNGGKSSLIGAGEMMLNIKDYNLQNSYNPQNNKNNSKDIKYANSRLKILEEFEKKSATKLEKEVEKIKNERTRREEEKAQKEQEVDYILIINYRKRIY